MAGQPVAVDPVVFRGQGVAVIIDRFVTYPTGVELRLSVRARSPDKDLSGFGRPVPPGVQLPEDLLRLGVLYADQRKATTVDLHSTTTREEQHPGSRLRVLGGFGDGRSRTYEVWLWPLPPPGPLRLVVEWPARGLPETSVEVDATSFADAANRAEQLFDEHDEGP